MTEAGWVALIGSFLTAVVAVVGYGISAWLARNAAITEGARLRYGELTRLYAEVGESMTLRRYALMRLQAEETSEKLEPQMLEEIRRVGEQIDPVKWSHLGQMLNLHGSSKPVNEAYDRFFDLNARWPASDGEIRSILLDAMEGAIQQFYTEAGFHAREVLTGRKKRRPKFLMPPGTERPNLQ